MIVHLESPADVHELPQLSVSIDAMREADIDVSAVRSIGSQHIVSKCESEVPEGREVLSWVGDCGCFPVHDAREPALISQEELGLRDQS